MREYFFLLLQNLDKLTGMKQYEKLCQTPKPKEEIKTLLDILCRVCDQFPFIPDEDKKRIINDAVIADQEFIGLNAKIIYKWLSVKKEFYTKPNGEPEISPEALTGEAREKRLEEWLKAINGMEMVQTKVDAFSTIKAIQPADGVVYSPQPVDAYEKERHFQYIKSNYDAKTGKPLPDFLPEEQWNELFEAGLIPIE